VELQSRRIAAQAVRVVLQKHFIHGQNLLKLATLIIVVKSAERQFKQNLHQVVQVVLTQLFTLGQSSNDFIGGSFATTDFFSRNE
jgi:hypothetical protein